MHPVYVFIVLASSTSVFAKQSSFDDLGAIICAGITDTRGNKDTALGTFNGATLTNSDCYSHCMCNGAANSNTLKCDPDWLVQKCIDRGSMGAACICGPDA